MKHYIMCKWRVVPVTVCLLLYTTVHEASYNCYYKTGLNKSLILSFSPPLTQNVGIKEGDQVRECMLAVCHYDIV